MALPDPIEVTVRFHPMWDEDEGRGSLTFFMGCSDVTEEEAGTEVVLGQMKAGLGGETWLSHNAEPSHQTWRIDYKQLWDQFEAQLHARYGETFLQRKGELIAKAVAEAAARSAAEKIEAEIEAEAETQASADVQLPGPAPVSEPEPEPIVTKPKAPGRHTISGGHRKEFPGAKRRSDLFPEYPRKAEASIRTWIGSSVSWAKHYTPIIDVECDPIWDGEAWRRLWADEKGDSFKLQPGLISPKQLVPGILSYDEIHAIAAEIEERAPLPDRDPRTLRDRDRELDDTKEHAYLTEEEAWEWVDAVWKLLLEPLGLFRLVRKGAPSPAEKKYDPRTRRPGD